MSTKYEEWHGYWISADGEYGKGVLTFDEDLLTDDQFQLFTEMHHTDRAPYVVSILDGDEERTASIEAEYGLDNDGEQE